MAKFKKMIFNKDKIENLLFKGLKSVKERPFWGKRIIPVDSDFIVLDHGCGTGAEIAQIQPTHRGYLVGNDIDIDMLIAAKRLLRKCCKTYRNVDLVLADSTHLPFTDSKFDVVLSSFVLEHIDKRENAVEEMYNVLKDKGFAIITLDTYLRCILLCLLNYIRFIVDRAYTRDYLSLILRARKHCRDSRTYSNRLEQLFKKIKRGIYTISYLILPIKHGEYEHSIQEFVAHLPSSWASLIKRSSFKKFDLTVPSSQQRVVWYPGEIMIKAHKTREPGD